MNRISALAATLAVTIAGTAMASEISTYRGEACVENWQTGQPDLYNGAGTRNMNATTSRWFMCPATRHDPSTSPSGGWVMVQDRSTRDRVTCYLQSDNIASYPIVGFISIVHSAGASDTPQKLTFGAVSAGTDYVYGIYCKLPAAPGGLGETSAILGYSITEG